MQTAVMLVYLSVLSKMMMSAAMGLYIPAVDILFCKDYLIQYLIALPLGHVNAHSLALLPLRGLPQWWLTRAWRRQNLLNQVPRG